MNPAPVDVVREAPAPFVLLDGIAHVTKSDLVGWRNFSEQPFWLALEAAALDTALDAVSACPPQAARLRAMAPASARDTIRFSLMMVLLLVVVYKQQRNYNNFPSQKQGGLL